MAPANVAVKILAAQGLRQAGGETTRQMCGDEGRAFRVEQPRRLDSITVAESLGRPLRVAGEPVELATVAE